MIALPMAPVTRELVSTSLIDGELSTSYRPVARCRRAVWPWALRPRDVMRRLVVVTFHLLAGLPHGGDR